jgi:hypothetical protein
MAAEEATFALSSSDCLSKLIFHIFDEKMLPRRTTNETILTNMFGSLYNEVMCKDLLTHLTEHQIT